MNTVATTIYGASDDLFELESEDRSIYEEYDCWGRPCVVRLTAPNGETLVVRGYFRYDGEWEVGVHEHPDYTNADWKVEQSQRPDRPSDPAIIVHVPVGTTAQELRDKPEFDDWGNSEDDA